MQGFSPMRDRLSHLQALSSSSGNVKELENAASLPLSSIGHQEEPSPEYPSNLGMEAVFEEAQDIRRDIQLIVLDVKHLHRQNSCAHIELPNSTTAKQESNAIAAGIKTRAEDLLERLHKMDEHARELAKMHGTDAAVSRIARTQYAALSNSFRDAMMEYNEAEMNYRETCKTHIQRQMEIVGREVTGEQIEEMLENGQWNVFSENVLTEGKTVRSALSQIESRHSELLELESRIKSIHEVFLDLGMLLEEQNSMINYIHTNVQKTDAAMKGMLTKLNSAKRYNRSNPFRKIFSRRR